MVVISLGLFVTEIYAQTEIARAQAMFIYNFSRLIEWPAEYKTGPFVVGVLGKGDIIEQLKTYTGGKSVGSQPITVKTFATPASISACHILFVPFSSTKEMSSITAQIQGKSTLIISEKNGAVNDGSAINFVIVGDKLKFELAPENATRYNIKISSKLNEMAFKVY
jgi:hypothetical protein